MLSKKKHTATSENFQLRIAAELLNLCARLGCRINCTESEHKKKRLKELKEYFLSEAIDLITEVAEAWNSERITRI